VHEETNQLVGILLLQVYYLTVPSQKQSSELALSRMRCRCALPGDARRQRSSRWACSQAR